MKYAIFFTYALLVAPAVAASVSPPPDELSYRSSNGRFELRIEVPSGLDGRLRDYLTMGDYGAVYFNKPELKRESLVCWLALYKDEGGRQVRTWERPNCPPGVIPKVAHVADSGSVLLLGEWWGRHDPSSLALAVFDRRGDSVRSLALSDLFTQKQILLLASRISYVWWGAVSSETVECVGSNECLTGEDSVDVFHVEVSDEVLGMDSSFPKFFLIKAAKAVPKVDPAR